MESRESDFSGHKCSSKDPVKEKTPLQRKWASEPSASTKQSTFADSESKHRDSLPCGNAGASAPQHKYALTGNLGKLLSGPSAIGARGGGSQEPQEPFVQGFPRGYSYQRGQPYPQHPQSERFLSGAKPQPGIEPHAWPFAGQLPSDDLSAIGHPGHTQPHGAGAGRFARQKSPSLPGCFRQYSQSGPEPAEEGYNKKEAKPKKPGKYICHYCGRACAKPSVLKKHIRSHTGERPYPCMPCGFSFKTKSNLYKHRKSHAHAIKAGLVPFSELAGARSGDLDQAETEVHSDEDQSTDTDEEGVLGSTMLTDKDGPIPQISFQTDKNSGDVEPAYADLAEELHVGSMKVPILIVPKPGGVPTTGMECVPFQVVKGTHHMLASHVGRAHSVDESQTIKQRLALRLTDKKGQDSDSIMAQSLNLLSPHSKGSTDSGYFSRSESAEQPISPPNTNAKTYEEIMFGRTWYYRPNARPRQSLTVGIIGADPSSLANLEQPGVDMQKMAEDHFFLRREVDPKQYPTGLLEPPSNAGPLIRSNSMPTSSPSNLTVPPEIRSSHSFDEMMMSDDVFYPPRRLRRQAAFEHSANEAHVGEALGCVQMLHHTSSLCLKISERTSAVPEHIAYSPHGTKVSMSEIATRKRRKEKSVGDEEDSPGHWDSSCSGSIELTGDYEFKQGSLDGSRGTPKGKGSLHSAHSHSDSCDACTSLCSEDTASFPDSEGRKAAGNVISVIQHTNSLSRPNSFEQSDSFEQLGHQTSDKLPSGQHSEQSDTDIFDDAASPESSLLRTDSMEQQLQSGSDLASLSSSSAAASPGQVCHIPHKLVRQPNIQVPEIRVTEEPEKPEKDTDTPRSREAERKQQQAEEFQLPQRSDTLSQMPSEKLPPKKKRLRLTDMEQSSGESSFESTCTSLSRSPSQESNLSHSSSFSMSFDRDEGLKSVSPTKQDDSASSGGPKQSEFLMVPGSGHSCHLQQREMRRSSSEQAPCTLPTEVPEMRSKSFDYGSLSSSRQGEVYSSASAMKERRRGYLVRQASLSVYPEAVAQEAGATQVAIKQEGLNYGAWPGPAGPPSNDLSCRSKRVGTWVGGVASHQHLQQGGSEDSLQDGPTCSRFQKHHLQAQWSSSEGENPGHEIINQEVFQQHRSSDSLHCFQQQGRFWSQETPRQELSPLQKVHPLYDGKSEFSQMYPASFSPLSQQQCIRHSLPSSTNAPMLLQQVQPVFATQSLGPNVSVPGMLVPVRIQTDVPSLGSVMYTSVSQLIATHDNGMQGTAAHMSSTCGFVSISKAPEGPAADMSRAGFHLSHLLGHTDGAQHNSHRKVLSSKPEQQLKTGIPLSLTSGTISTTDASGSSIGGSKRMLSPASSLELFTETKQQKRVKEENMYGQIVKEMSAVELSGPETSSKPDGRVQQASQRSKDSVEDSRRMSSSPPLSDLHVANKIVVPVRSSAPHPPDVPWAESFTPPLQIVPESSLDSKGQDSPESSSSPQSMMSSNDAEDSDEIPVSMLVQLASTQSSASSAEVGQVLLLTDVTDVQRFSQFPSLRTMSRVSWCFLHYPKPNSTPVVLHSSVYSSWCVSSHNPNPLNLSTKAALALLRSKQQRSSPLIYTPAALSPPNSGKLVSSVAWKLRCNQLQPELMPSDATDFVKKMKGVEIWNRSNKEQIEKDVKRPSTEPTRIKIFEGGYKSNEDYIYVRGRGRGKYICEECGIRCKKPSMLKKHIRTHTDVRPYVCKFCNFAFKTKGNLTKHMKSKAHMKKCLELGVSTSSVEDEADEGDECHRAEKVSRLIRHQFSDADDSEGGEEDGDEVDDEDDEEEDCDGDCTPITHSRSTSPKPSSSQQVSPPPPLLGYFTTVPSIQIMPQPPPSNPTGTEHRQSEAPPGLQQVLHSRLPAPPIDDGHLIPSFRMSSPTHPDYSGCPSPISPSSSPSAHRYLSPHLSPQRDISPLRHISPKRDLGVAGGYRRDLSPRRGHLSLPSPLSRPTSPAGSDYKRDISPRGRHRGAIWPVSPRRGLHQQQSCQHSGARALRVHSSGPLAQADLEALGCHQGNADMETGRHPGSPIAGWDQTRSHSNQSSPPHQVLFSHLPLHSQLQVRSPFPMIQMVHASTPLSQQEAQKSPSFTHQKSLQEREGGRRLEQEENIHTCTRAIASLCIDSQEPAESEGASFSFSSSSPSAVDSQQHTSQQSPQPPPGPGIQHFSGPSPPPNLDCEPLQHSTESKPQKLQKDKEKQSTKRIKELS
ncbi:transcription factor HIVEP2a [Brachionichthys hirsutus]|uniref:transcription factor HIVEP2a n=1 Tax=Brachionichthys hirsutus TaxID=412623 RepID=UPI0036050A83